MQGIKQALRLLQDRLSKVEAGSGEPKSEDAEKLPSSTKDQEENIETKEKSVDEILDAPHSTVNDKILDDLQYDIASLKDKLPNVQFMEGEIENMKK